MHRRWLSLPLLGWLVAAAACFAAGGPLPSAIDDAGPPPALDLDDAGLAATRGDVDVGDAFSVDAVTPSHGPYSGGTRVTLRGRGFPAKLRVWVGDVEVPESDRLASDAQRAAVVTPKAHAGLVDVRVRNDATAEERVLRGAFTYDAIVAEPDSGSTLGGTRIVLRGSGTGFRAGTTVTVDGAPCDVVNVVGPEQLECVTPKGSPGSKELRTVTPQGDVASARDAFTYADSVDGYRGGLAGSALAGSMRVLALDAWAGLPIAGAYVVAGALAPRRTDAAGLAVITDSTLSGKATVTIAAKCHQPMTYVDVPVEQITAYLSPVLDPSCADGDPPLTGGRPGPSQGAIEGELIWTGGVEFERAAWNGVPLPARATERRAAYVFTAARSPTDTFVLPDASLAVTPDADGRRGYHYALNANPGAAVLYALAGIEERSSGEPRFTPYVMGVARGVVVQPGAPVAGVDLAMTIPLDQSVRVLPTPPSATSRGPDRLALFLAPSLATGAFALLPAMSRSVPLGSSEVAFRGVPALVGPLEAESYVVSARAATSASMALPASAVARFRTRDTANAVTLGGFVPIPVLREPSVGFWSGRHVELTASGAVDLVALVVSSAGGLVAWTIVGPGTAQAFDLPDLAALPDRVGLARGALTVQVYAARIDGFRYDRLRQGQIAESAFSAFATDVRTLAY